MRSYSTEKFYAETRVVVKEAFQIVEWMIVVVAMLYAGARTGIIWFTAIGWTLYVLLGLYTLDCVMRALWAVAPSLGPNKPRSARTILAAVCVLAAVSLGQQLTESLVGHLLRLQLSDSKAQEPVTRNVPSSDDIRIIEPMNDAGKPKCAAQKSSATDSPNVPASPTTKSLRY